MLLATSVVVVALGMVGDLFESLLKRSAGVKDSSTLIPGHGGVLDRIDSWLFAAPVFYVFVMYLQTS